MDALLSQIGLKGSTPDASKYEATKQVTDQIQEVKGKLAGMLGPIDYGIRAAEFSGIGTGAVSQLNVFKQRIQSLIDNTKLTPEELEKQRAELAADISKSSTSIEASIQQEDLTRTTTALEKIQKEYDAIKNDTSISKELKEAFVALLDKAKNSVTVQQNRLKGVYTAVNTGPSGPSNPVPPFVVAEELEGELQNLLDRAQDEINKGDVNFSRIWRKFYYTTQTFFSWFFFIAAALFGGVGLSNTFASEQYLPIRLYYFFYGALFFPFTLTYIAIRPPAYVATIAPVYKIPTDSPPTLNPFVFEDPMGKPTSAKLRFGSVFLLVGFLGTYLTSGAVKLKPLNLLG